MKVIRLLREILAVVDLALVGIFLVGLMILGIFALDGLKSIGEGLNKSGSSTVQLDPIPLPSSTPYVYPSSVDPPPDGSIGSRAWCEAQKRDRVRQAYEANGCVGLTGPFD